MTDAKQFVFNYWFDSYGTPKCKLSKSVTEILGYFDNGKLTLDGVKAYRRLTKNLNDI